MKDALLNALLGAAERFSLGPPQVRNVSFSFLQSSYIDKMPFFVLFTECMIVITHVFGLEATNYVFTLHDHGVHLVALYPYGTRNIGRGKKIRK